MAGSIRDDFQRKFHQFHTHATNILRPKQLSDFFRRNPWALYQLSMRHTPKFCRVLEGQNQSKSCQVSILEGTSRNIMVIPSLYHVLQAKKVLQFPAAFFLPVFTRQFLQFPCQEIDEMIRMCDSDGDGQVRSTETPATCTVKR